jgi:hypothetical protein
MERVAVQVCIVVDLQKISTSQVRHHARVREIFHYPKRENFNARATGLADGLAKRELRSPNQPSTSQYEITH